MPNAVPEIADVDVTDTVELPARLANTPGLLRLTLAKLKAFIGIGIPAGGTTGQALVKVSNADYDANWGTVAAGLTAEQIEDLIAGMIQAGANISVNYDDALDTFTITGTASPYTDEQVRDVIGTALVAGSNITITVNDGGDTITIASTGGGSAAIGRKLLGAMPALSGFTQHNITGTRSIVEVAGKAISIIESSPASGAKIAGISKAMPGTGTNRVVFFVQTNAPGWNYIGWAFGFSDGTKFHTMVNHGATPGHMTWSTATTRVLDSAISPAPRFDFFHNTGFWFAVRDNGTTLYWEVSSDGVNFTTIFKIAKAGSYLVASGGGVTQAFVGMFTEGSAATGTDYPHSVSIISYDDSGAARTFDA